MSPQLLLVAALAASPVTSAPEAAAASLLSSLLRLPLSTLELLLPPHRRTFSLASLGLGPPSTRQPQ